MKGIRGLLIKDLCLMGEIRKLLLIILFVTAIFIFNGTSSTFLTGYIMIIIAFLVGMTISYDEMNNGLAFLMTLPVTRRQYVAEKFICGLLSLFLGFVYTMVVAVIQSMIGNSAPDLKESIMTAVLFAVIGVIVLSFSIAIDLKFGAEKGRVMLLLGFMVIFFLFYMGVAFLERNFPEKKEAFLQWFNTIFEGSKIYPVCAVICAVVLLLSFFASCRTEGVSLKSSGFFPQYNGFRCASTAFVT